MRRVLILGATSPIARALCSELASMGDSLCLAGRDQTELQAIAQDLGIRHGGSVGTAALVAEDLDSHHALFLEARQSLGGLDGVVLLIGELGLQPRDSHDPSAAARLIEVNMTGPASLLAWAGNCLEKEGKGFILAFSSVAGDRGRRSNYAYGAAKGGLNLFVEGLRHRLDGKGIRVINIKLGFVDTEMTWGLPGLFQVATPAQVARFALRALERPARTYYFPAFWRLLMFVIRNLPEPIFKKLNL